MVRGPGPGGGRGGGAAGRRAAALTVLGVGPGVLGERAQRGRERPALVGRQLRALRYLVRAHACKDGRRAFSWGELVRVGVPEAPTDDTVGLMWSLWPTLASSPEICQNEPIDTLI